MVREWIHWIVGRKWIDGIVWKNMFRIVWEWKDNTTRRGNCVVKLRSDGGSENGKEEE